MPITANFGALLIGVCGALTFEFSPFLNSASNVGKLWISLF